MHREEINISAVLPSQLVGLERIADETELIGFTPLTAFCIQQPYHQCRRSGPIFDPDLYIDLL
jgi:hypothetical protein